MTTANYAPLPRRVLPALTDALGNTPETVISWHALTLGRLIEEQLGCPVRYYGDIYHVLEKPAAVFKHHDVRLLTPADAPLLEAAPPELRGPGWGSTQNMLQQGVVPCAVINEQVVAIAHTSAHSPRHADIGVYTHEAFRNRGLSTAAASLVAQQVQQTDRIPVWSVGQDNLQSLGVAQKLGFAEVSRKTYVILKRRG